MGSYLGKIGVKQEISQIKLEIWELKRTWIRNNKTGRGALEKLKLKGKLLVFCSDKNCGWIDFLGDKWGWLEAMGGGCWIVMDRHNSLFFASVWYTYSIHLRVWKFNVQYKPVFPPRIHHFRLGVLVDTKTFLPFFNMGFGFCRRNKLRHWWKLLVCRDGLILHSLCCCLHLLSWKSGFSVEISADFLLILPSPAQAPPPFGNQIWQLTISSPFPLVVSCQVRLSENIPLGFFHGFFPLKCAHSVFHHLGQIHPKVWMVTHFPQITNRLGKSC